ncbi:unnamed protein product [Brachionus calyciflorus]|uniref:Uncharacterized protein n=1 Tax=Brachionus calyciflorus TaxID=104777 RepID=A0A813V555_9BILA|nr:unnamed protein product [Brachionus calyciflorus]
MEPIDYEKFLITNRCDLEKDPLRHIIFYPSDDIELVEITKKVSTLDQLKPEIEAELDIHVSECVKSYNSNYRAIIKNYEKYSSYNLIKSKKSDLNKIAKKCDIQEYECDSAQASTETQISTDSSENSQQRTSWLLSDLEKLDPDPIIPSLFERLPPEVIDRENEILRETQRVQALFQFYPNQDMTDQQIVIENRLNPPPPKELEPNRILIKCTHLKFDLEIEPIWASMALYDLKHKKKVSENFYFDLNTDALKHMLNSHQTHEDLSTQAKSCIFNITHPSNDLYLVVRVDKVLQQGDISECAEPYVKSQQQSQSSLEKLSSNAQQFCERLGKYRMPFVWTAINVMNILNNNQTSQESSEKSTSLDRRSTIQQTKSVKSAYESFRKGPRDESLTRQNQQKSEEIPLNLNKFKPIAISINTFFKQESDKLSDEDLYRCLNDLKKSTNLIKKLKCLPGCLKLEFSPFNINDTKSLQNFFILSPELQLVKSNSLLNSQINQEKTHYHQPLLFHNHLLPIKDLIEFPCHPILEPNFVYRNLLYVYPLSVNLCGVGSGQNNVNSSLLNSSSARNIAIKVNLMKGEEGEHCALPVIFAKSSSTVEYCKEVYANVVYHNKTPQYSDEIKIKLPALVSNSNYHLLFTFYHVSCQNSKDQLDTVIGYSWLPLEQQFQYETTVQFVNTNNQGLQPNIANASQDQEINFKKGASQEVDGKISSFTKVTRCQMVKSGIYSLPISFEKLPSGYSALNYSIYDNSNNIPTSNIFDDQLDSLIENSSNKDEKIPVANITNVSTIITNSPNSTTSLNSAQNAASNITLSGPGYSKSFFDLRLKFVSTIHTQDIYLENFIKFSNLNNQNQQLGIELSKVEINLLKHSISDLCFVETEALYKFLNIVLDKLFNLMVNTKPLSSLCFETIAKIVNKINNLSDTDSKRNRLLVQYIKYSTNLDNYLLHEDILNEWLCQMSKKITPETQILRDILLKNSWFYFEMIFKSLGLFLLKFKNNLNSNTTLNLSLTSKISKKFLFDLEQLIKLLIIEIVNMQQMSLNKIQSSFRSCTQVFLSLVQIKSNEKLSAKLSNSLGFFINDLFSLLDRGFLFKLVDLYYAELNKYLINLNTQLKILAKSSSNLKYTQFKFLILNSIRAINSQQLDFLRILSSNEHFIQLNLPIGNYDFKIYESKEYFHRHFLIGLIIRQIFRTLHLPFKHLHFKASQLIRNLIESNDLDLRYQTAKSRLAQLFFPLINLTIHFLPFFISAYQFKNCHVTSDTRSEFDLFLNEFNLTEDNLNSDYLAEVNLNFDLNDDLNYLIDFNVFNRGDFLNDQSNFLYPLFDNCNFSINPEECPKIKGKKISDESSIYFYLSQKHCLCNNNLLFYPDESGVNLKTTQDCLASFIWIVKNLDKKFLFNLLTTWSYSKINKLLILIDLTNNLFEYRSGITWSNTSVQLLEPVMTTYEIPKAKSKFKTKIEDLMTLANAAQGFKKTKEDDLEPKVKWRSLKNKDKNDSNFILEGNLSTEFVLISLDLIDLIVKIIQVNQLNQNNFIFESNSQSQYLLSNIMRILLNSLNLEQSTKALINLFSHQRSLVIKFPELLFEDDTEYCSDLCMRLLKHSTSNLQTVRAQASASLYFLMRQNFDIGNNFSRVKMQVTMSLSSLVAGNKINPILIPSLDPAAQAPILNSVLIDFYNVKCLKRSLKTILFYAESDLELIESSFPSQVKDLVLNLNTILSDTVKMRENQDDPEMLIDLMHRIANCYQNSPDMRLIWLQNMAQKHLQQQNLVEAGQCLIHAAALVAEYISLIENKPYLPVGCANFKNVSVNVLEESAVSDDVLISPFDEGVCTGKYFSETGLIGLIEQAAVFLVHSQHYEVANQLYKILIPIYEAHKDIKKLSQVHSKLHDCFNKILLNSNKRLFGTYFRVGFYGEKFEDLNGEEFIYKEPGITKLAEIAHRLENFYCNKFGQGVVEIMKDSNNVDKNSLDLVTKAYIQITYVEPYFDRYELSKCETFFEKNYSLKRFIYATPFTMDGKAHGPLNQQYKRKTVLTTERAFPYVKTRIPVIDKSQFVLGPVEVAIEDLQKKIDELKNATLQEPADPKILQMVLQGCVGTTVNQGPLEMAMTFLQPISSETITEHHNKLRICFKEFSRRCADALKKNKTLIGPDQYEYQREMERNCTELKAKIDPLIENKLFKANQNNLKSY